MTAIRRTVDLRPTMQRLLVAAAALTVVVEIVSLFGLLPSIPVGGYELSPSILPAVLLVAVLGRRLVGRAGDARAEVVFWGAWLLAFAGLAVAFLRIGEASTLPAILGAAFDEELVYRLAVPLLITLALVGWGWRHDRARVVGFLGAGLWFVLLPGHRAQMSVLADALPFLAFAALASVVVYRSGSVLAVIAIHLSTDLVNLLALQHRIAPLGRAGILGALFLLLVMAYDAPQRRHRPASVAGPADGVTPDDAWPPEVEIDLRDPVPGPASPDGPSSDDDDDEHLPVG